MGKTIHPLKKISSLLMVTLFAVLLAGCGSAIDPGAFHRFTESTVELREGADEVLGLQYDWALERFIEETVAGDEISEEKVQKLLLENVPEVPFAWTAGKPPLLFFEVRRFRETVRALNDALVQYAELLAELAVAGNMGEEEFKATAEGINSGLRDATATFSEDDFNKGIAFFSTGATALFQGYLKSKTKDKLREALAGNQKNILDLSQHLRDAMRLASQHAFAEYGPRSLELAISLTPDSGLNTDKKKDRVLELIELDELLIKRLDTLRRLDDSYRALPAANRELMESLDKGQGGLAAIYRIRDNAKRLRELYKELAEPSDGQGAGSAAESNGE